MKERDDLLAINTKIVKNYYKEHLTLFDDRIFREVVEDKAFVRELLSVILDDRGLTVIESTAQKNFSVLNQRGIILDAYCKLSDGRIVNIEVEKNDKLDKCNHQKRVRYYGSMINVKNLKQGQSFDELPDVYVIYITKKDIFKKGKATYHIKRMLDECGIYVDNGYHEIYINAEVNDKTAISEVIKIMSTKDYINNDFKTISKVKEEKTMPAEVQKAMDYLKNAYRTEGRAEGKAEGFISLLKQQLISEEVVLNNLNINKSQLKELLKKY